MIQVELPNTIAWPKIEKFKNILGNKLSLVAYQYDRDLVRVRLIFPYLNSLARKEDLGIFLKKRSVEIDFPKGYFAKNKNKLIKKPVNIKKNS